MENTQCNSASLLVGVLLSQHVCMLQLHMQLSLHSMCVHSGLKRLLAGDDSSSSPWCFHFLESKS